MINCISLKIFAFLFIFVRLLITGQNGKYWHADSEGVTVDSDVPSDGFYLELREPSRICIKCSDGRYLTAGKNGALRLGDSDYETATKWEF